MLESASVVMSTQINRREVEADESGGKHDLPSKIIKQTNRSKSVFSFLKLTRIKNTKVIPKNER